MNCLVCTGENLTVLLHHATDSRCLRSIKLTNVQDGPLSLSTQHPSDIHSWPTLANLMIHQNRLDGTFSIRRQSFHNLMAAFQMCGPSNSPGWPMITSSLPWHRQIGQIWAALLSDMRRGGLVWRNWFCWSNRKAISWSMSNCGHWMELLQGLLWHKSASICEVWRHWTQVRCYDSTMVKLQIWLKDCHPCSCWRCGRAKQTQGIWWTDLEVGWRWKCKTWRQYFWCCKILLLVYCPSNGIDFDLDSYLWKQ